MRVASRTALCLSSMLVAGVASVSAEAQAPSLEQETLAETLFQDGRRLMEEGRFADACPKLAESQAIDPGGGTVLLLALCYRQVGKTASAWVKFNEALAAARRDGRKDRAERAALNIAKLEPLLSRVTISVPPEVVKTRGIEVLLDGAAVPNVAWGHPLPVDPGSHAIEARAPGKRTWSTTVEIGEKGDLQGVDVPHLDDLPTQEAGPAVAEAPVSPAPVSPAPDTTPARDVAPTGEPSHILAYVVGGVGLVAVSAGGFFGVRALDRNAEARDLCPKNACADSEGVDLNARARSDATRANALLGAGLVLAGVGTYLWLSAPDDTGAGTALLLRPDPSASGISIGSETRW